MVFLIEYNRKKAELVKFKSYDESDVSIARDERLELELQLMKQGINHEVVLLIARDEAALRRTHGRYFSDIREILLGVA